MRTPSITTTAPDMEVMAIPWAMSVLAPLDEEGFPDEAAEDPEEPLALEWTVPSLSLI